MKRALQVILALGFVGMFLVSPVAAATSQGLEWGVVVGDSFDFTITSSEDDISEDITLNITSAATFAIPDPLSDWNDIPNDLGIGFWWANDTSMGIFILAFLGLFFTGGQIAVPVGNWTLMSSLIASEVTGETITDTSNLWGVVYVDEFNSTHENRITAHYSKADGFLAEYKIQEVVSATEVVTEEFSIIRDNIPAGPIIPGDAGDILQLLQDNILYVAIGVGVLLIIVILCKKK
ncbi:MAG: hypothetical protein ACTSQZ_07305 [Candidatus Thorarchaeota archaeon]